MARFLPKEIERNVKEAIFQKADKIDYLSCGRADSGRFMSDLVDDPKIGGILKEYIPKEKIRTYIKDAGLHAYAESRKNELLESTSPEIIIQRIYQKDASIIQSCTGKNAGVCVLRGKTGEIYVISSGNVLKWETALKKALDIIAREPGLTVHNRTPNICLKLADLGRVLTASEKAHITMALSAINVKAFFC